MNDFETLNIVSPEAIVSTENEAKWAYLAEKYNNWQKIPLK